MRTFTCDRCSSPLGFDVLECPSCGTQVGYVSQQREIRTLVETPATGTFRLGGDGDEVWRCLNAAWRCNWVVPAGSESLWCRSCGLTRGRPSTGRTDAIESWIDAEAAKRRLVHQLDDLALPIDAKSDGVPGGLAFDLVDVPEAHGVTGHLDGVVTLDLAEVDEAHRDELRRRLGEPIRTVIGHLRHEVGHYYWTRLVGQTNDVARFRTIFGDERSDYMAAIERYYATGADAWDRATYVTAYASSHPLEDWAESFAHYLHILDAVDTAAAHGLMSTPRDRHVDLVEILDRWRPINVAVNSIAESLGKGPVYPIEPTATVVDKLTYVHDQIAAHNERHRFYADA